MLTGGYLVFVAWLTLTPQPISPADEAFIDEFLARLHSHGYLESLDYDQLEFLANIALFVPIGMFLMLLFGTRLWWLALLACFAMTAFIETAQRAIPGRVPDGRDLVANSLGAVLGVLLALVLTMPAALRRRRVRHARRGAGGHSAAQRGVA